MTRRRTGDASPHAPKTKTQTHQTLTPPRLDSFVSGNQTASANPRETPSPDVRELSLTMLCRQPPIFIHKCPSEPHAVSTHGCRFAWSFRRDCPGSSLGRTPTEQRTIHRKSSDFWQIRRRRSAQRYSGAVSVGKFMKRPRKANRARSAGTVFDNLGPWDRREKRRVGTSSCTVSGWR